MNKGISQGYFFDFNYINITTTVRAALIRGEPSLAIYTDGSKFD